MKNRNKILSIGILFALLLSCSSKEEVVAPGPVQPLDSQYSSTPISEGTPLSSIDFPATDLPNLTGNNPNGTPVDNSVEAKEARKQVILQAVRDMVYVDGGSFLMGATAEQGTENIHPYEKPVHKVTVSSYYISKFLVTHDLYWYVMGATDQTHAVWKSAVGESIHTTPMENRTYTEFQNFIAKLNTLTGLSFAMPTEAQWEFAARGGRKRGQATMYAGGNNLSEVAWYLDNCIRTPIPAATITTSNYPSLGIASPVGKKRPNELGLYDMSGNMAEMCQDYYLPYPADGGDRIDPIANILPEGALSKRVVRGGSWLGFADACRVSARSGANSPGTRYYMISMRLAHPKQ